MRSGAKSVPEMKKGLLPSCFHVASSEDCNFHTYCPATKDTWCQYQRDLINETNLYKPGKVIDESELAKCLHGQTRNANESFTSLIWERAPKIRYCVLMKMKLCVYDAISHFQLWWTENFRHVKVIEHRCRW